MRVLYIAHYFLSNIAAGITTRQMIKMLLQRGYQVTLITPSTYIDYESELQQCAGFRLKSSFSGIPNWIARRSKLISMFVATLGYLFVFTTGLGTVKKKGSFSRIIVMYHTFHLAPLIGYILSRLTKAPLVVKVHDVVPRSDTESKLESIFYMVLSKINRIALVHARLVLSLSTEISQIIIKYTGLEKSKIVVLSNSIDLKDFSTSFPVSKPRSLLGLEEKKVVLFIGSFFENRGLEVLLAALRNIKDERVVSLVVGDCGEKYMELAREMKIDQKVFFIGQVSHDLVPLYINMADVCVGPLLAGPYTYGGVPRKVIEYMACGKPLIVARGAVTEDLARDRVSALVVSYGDEDGVARAILSLINDSQLSMKIGTRARQIIAERYSTEKLAEKLDRTLRDLMYCSQSRIV